MYTACNEKMKRKFTEEHKNNIRNKLLGITQNKWTKFWYCDGDFLYLVFECDKHGKITSKFSKNKLKYLLENTICIQKDVVGKWRVCFRNKKNQARYQVSRLWFSDSETVRHLDGDTLNNTDENLATGSHAENMLDSCVGCSMNQGKWEAQYSQFKIIHKRIYVGRHKTALIAQMAWYQMHDFCKKNPDATRDQLKQISKEIQEDLKSLNKQTQIDLETKPRKLREVFGSLLDNETTKSEVIKYRKKPLQLPLF
jgi:uncharacterized FlaG/YvyC family protein